MKPSLSRKSYFEALSIIQKRNNSEIRKIRSKNPYISAAQKIFTKVNEITARTLISIFFSYNSLKNRKMSDNEQKFRKKNK